MVNIDEIVSDPAANEGDDDTAEKGWIELMGKDVVMKTISTTASAESNNPISVQPKDAVVVDFVGRFAAGESKDDDDDGPIFHEAADWIVVVSERDVIPALELCIRFMNVGDTAVVWSSSKFAYGPSERKHNDYVLPPHSNIRYKVTVKSVIPDSDRDSDPSTQIKLSQSKKNIGNDVYANEWSHGQGKMKAIQLYKRGADGVEHLAVVKTEDDRQQQQKYSEEITKQAKSVHVDCLNNIAAVYMRAKDYNKAKKACVDVLSYHPGNRKALLRAAKACLLDTASSYEEVQAAIDAAVAETTTKEDGIAENDDDVTNNNYYNVEIQKLQLELKRRKSEYKKKSKDMFSGMVKETKKEKQQQEAVDTKDKKDAVTGDDKEEQQQQWDFGWKKFLYQLLFQLTVVVVMAKFFNNKKHSDNASVINQEEFSGQQDDQEQESTAREF